jgi:CubicO group peptidase (beta-lactamase class C family)
MERTRNKGFKTIIGIILMNILFLLPIAYTSYQPVASANTYTNTQPINKNDFIKLIYKNKIDKIDSFVDKHKKHYRFQGNILVGHKGNVIYSESIGYADPNKETKLTENSLFQLASVTKQFTAMGIMILKERGQLSYSDTVQKFLPVFPYKGITIRMLLNHTAGLPNYMWLLEHRWKKNRIPYNDDVVNLMAKHKLNLYFKPGTRFSYSNTGYVILASIIEEASGERYDQFLKHNIFDPLNMKNTKVVSAAYKNNPKKILNGYYKWGRIYRSIPHNINDGTVGDKGIYSTAEDLFKWDQALYENTLITKETKQEAYTKLTLKNGNRYPYGFGFRLKNYDDKKAVYHYGKWNGFRTGLIRFIEDTTTIIILNHTNRPGTSKITQNVKDIIYNEQV